MNYLHLKQNVYNYLGVKIPSEAADGKILPCFEELENIINFRYTYKVLETLPEFLFKDPYLTFLSGSKKIVLSITTLGAEVDRRIKLLSRADMEKSVIFDACASAMLEELADEYEKTIDKDLSYRFCPGYGGSDVKDVKYIFDILKPEKTGVTLTENFYMLPSKSMAGILAVGAKDKKTCGNCVILKNCKYREEGRRCYGSEKK